MRSQNISKFFEFQFLLSRSQHIYLVDTFQYNKQTIADLNCGLLANEEPAEQSVQHQLLVVLTRQADQRGNSNRRVFQGRILAPG